MEDASAAEPVSPEPTGFFTAVESDSPVLRVLDRLRPSVEAELERYDGTAVTVRAEIRAAPGTNGDVDLERFYWSSQVTEPAASFGFGARTLHCGKDTGDLRVHEFPSDPTLAWLDHEVGPLHGDARGGRVEVLRYIPLRRLTYRLTDGAGLPPSVIGKVKTPGGLSRAASALLAVNQAASRRHGAPRVPAVLRLEPPRHVLYLEELPGDPLDLAIAHLDTAEAMQRLGALHRDLQQLEVKGLPVHRIVDWLRESRRAAQQVGLFVPSVAGQAAAVQSELERKAPSDGRLVLCQGDFLPGQVLCDPSGWSVIDFDDSRYADPLSDVAAMYSAMPRELHLPAAEVGHARRVYVDAFAALGTEPFDEDRWRWFLALHQLSELGKRLMKGRVGPGETQAVLDGLTREAA